MPHLHSATELVEVFNEFAPHFDGRCCIAGGAVRDLIHGYTPKDYDVFTFQRPRWRHLQTSYELAGEQHHYRDMLCLTLKWEDKLIQIVHRSTLTTVPALLQEFDLDICQYAWDGVAVRKTDTTAPLIRGGTIRVVNPWTPSTTLERMQRFCRRFSMKPDQVSLVMLHERIGSSRRLAKVAEMTQRRGMRRLAA